MVDFNIADFQADYDMDIISDKRALAHFFNNLGAEFMQRGELAAAFYAFRRAIAENDRSFAPAWDSLGTLYSRNGLSYHAEAAFLQALEIDRSDLTAMNNLTVLYDRRGDTEQAARYRNKVNSHRKRNPYLPISAGPGLLTISRTTNWRSTISNMPCERQRRRSILRPARHGLPANG